MLTGGILLVSRYLVCKDRLRTAFRGKSQSSHIQTVHPLGTTNEPRNFINCGLIEVGEVIRGHHSNHPLGTMNVLRTFHGSLDISWSICSAN